MFLTKKSFLKILVMVIVYFAIGTFSIVSSIVFNYLGATDNFLLYLGIIVYLICPLIIFWGCYAEGKGKFINLGNKLILKELKPAEFIKHYISLEDSDKLIINKPSVDVLSLVLMAYDSLDDRENSLKTVDNMIEISCDKKKNLSKLLKVSLLFSYGETDEAEALFNEIRKEKLDLICNNLVDNIIKSDRALAYGDFKTAKVYHIKTLERSFPKLQNLEKLISYFKLGEISEKLQDTDNAITYYQYCANFGGETAIRNSAVERLNCLK